MRGFWQDRVKGVILGFGFRLGRLMRTKKRVVQKRKSLPCGLMTNESAHPKGNTFLPCIPPEGVPLPFLGSVRGLSVATDQVELVGLLCVRPGLVFFVRQGTLFCVPTVVQVICQVESPRLSVTCSRPFFKQ